MLHLRDLTVLCRYGFISLKPKLSVYKSDWCAEIEKVLSELFGIAVGARRRTGETNLIAQCSWVLYQFGSYSILSTRV